MIEVNEYVRTNNGEIHKVLDTEKGSIKIKSQYKEWIGLCCIKKHSKKLIDLIEIGDIVNKGYVYEIKNTENGDKWIHNLNGFLLFEEDIKTILTHEQYMANCYKVGGEDEC